MTSDDQPVPRLLTARLSETPPSGARAVSGVIPAGSEPHASAQTVVVHRTQPEEPEPTQEAPPQEAEPPPEPEPGARFGRYVILERLGQGGMGVVYGAYDSELDRRVALKLLRTRGRKAEGLSEGRARLLREAKAMAKLSHPNVVAVHDVGTLEGRVFLAMEYVEGLTLTRWLRKRKPQWREIRDHFVQAARGLAAAHEVGLVHRDFKPDNVLVGRDGRVRVTDFGLARASQSVEIAGSEGDETGPEGRCCVNDELTQPGLIMGTLPYMPPEQVVGMPSDHRIDQFAFCVALFEALYSRRPFGGRNREERCEQIAKGRIRAVPKGSRVPGWLHAAVVRGLANSAGQRWPNMQVLVQRLRGPRSIRRGLAVAGAVGGSTIATAMALGLGAPDTQCQGAQAQLDAVWGPSHKAAAREAFVASGSIHVDETWSRVETLLDAYGERWADMRVEACQATARGEQSAELLDLRMACLDDHLEELSALVDAAGERDARILDGATWAAANLPAVSHCARAEVLAAELHPPAPDEAAAIAEVRTELAHVGIRARLSAPEASLAAIGAVLERARELGDAPITASALRLLGVTQARAGDNDGARESLSEAALLAAAAQDHRVAAAAATAMMGIVGPEDFKQGLLWGWYAEAAVDRLGEGGPEHADMLDGLGAVFAAHRKYDEARDHYQHAVELREDIQGLKHPSLSRSLVGLGDALTGLDQTETAESVYVRAVAVAEAAFGPEHPELAAVLQRCADAAQKAGNPGLATEHRTRAAALERTGRRGSLLAGLPRHAAP